MDFEGDLMKSLLMGVVAVILTGCGVVYQTSSLSSITSTNVNIVALTAEVVLEANKSFYDPLKLPKVFSSNKEGSELTPEVVSILDPDFHSVYYSGAIDMHLPESSQPKPYLIGVGDVVMLSTPGADSIVEALNGLIASQNRRQGYTVQDDGAVSIPDIGRVVIGGLTLEEAEDAVYRKLVEVGVSPSFSIEVTEFNSQRVSVFGAVMSPGIEPIALQPLYLDEVISRKGGISIDNAFFVIIRLYRNGLNYQIPGQELYSDNVGGKILLRDGDRIVVDVTDDYDNFLGLRQRARENVVREREMEMEANANESRSVLSRLQYGTIRREYVYIIGEVGIQSRFTLPFENRAFLADALLESGGGVLPLSGNPKQIYVLRGTSGLNDISSITALHLDASNAANFILATHLELRPKDVVFVGAQPITNWNRMINQIIPSLNFSRE
jgi:polysaccharide biosynthesis/export protein|tara:strand:+ start:3801 stop:5120 length:1320 start_codon:yes stop_codon:yes gene_type:complete